MKARSADYVRRHAYQSKNPMRHICLHHYWPVLILLSACSSLPKPSPQPLLWQNTAVLLPAKLQAGCLLPAPSLLEAVKAPSTVRLVIRVNEFGHPTEARVVETTGDQKIDEAFVSSATNCSFSPASSGGVPTAYWYELRYSWAQSQNFVGPARCFREPYPRRALLAGETATVKVQFRLPSNGGAVQTRVTSSQPSPLLSTVSVNAVERCLEHSEARKGIDIDRWYGISYDWRIQE